MSAKHGAKQSAAWTRELDVILLDGIEARAAATEPASARRSSTPRAGQAQDVRDVQ